jgi:flagellar basal body-associated protein FliL
VPRARFYAIVATAVALLAGMAEMLTKWAVLLGSGQQVSEPSGGDQSSGPAAGAARESVQTLTGDVVQDNSRNVVLYNTTFRLEVVRATDTASDTTRQVRDDILSVLDELVGAENARALSPEQARALGRRLGSILDEAPISPYRLRGREFTLRPGTAYYVPGGDDSIAFVGPAGDGAANAIAIRRNGRESTMAVGAVREFRQGAESCRLLLHEVTADFSAAMFSYTCRP